MLWDSNNKAEYHRAYYLANKEKIIKASAASKEVARRLARELVINYLANNPCVDCGEDDIVVLEFDHVDRAEKKFTISKAVRDGMKLSRIEEEIEKCEVRCANCHRRKTYLEMGYYSRSYPHQVDDYTQPSSKG